MPKEATATDSPIPAPNSWGTDDKEQASTSYLDTRPLVHCAGRAAVPKPAHFGTRGSANEMHVGRRKAGARGPAVGTTEAPQEEQPSRDRCVSINGGGGPPVACLLRLDVGEASPSFEQVAARKSDAATLPRPRRLTQAGLSSRLARRLTRWPLPLEANVNERLAPRQRQGRTHWPQLSHPLQLRVRYPARGLSPDRNGETHARVRQPVNDARHPRAEERHARFDAAGGNPPSLG